MFCKALSAFLASLFLAGSLYAAPPATYVPRAIKELDDARGVSLSLRYVPIWDGTKFTPRAIAAADIGGLDASFATLTLTGMTGGGTRPILVNNSGLFTSVTPADFRTATGLAIGMDIQGYDPDLDYLASFTPTANIKSILNAADYAAVRALLDLEPGTDVIAPGAIGSSGLTTGTAKLLGRYSAGTGAIQEITVGTGLDLDGSGNLTSTVVSGGFSDTDITGQSAIDVIASDDLWVMYDTSGTTLAKATPLQFLTWLNTQTLAPSAVIADSLDAITFTILDDVDHVLGLEIHEVSDITGSNKKLNIVTGNADRTLTLNGDATLPGGDALVANPLSQFAATTSAQLYGVISNETGSASGSPLAVFNQNPAIVSPKITTGIQDVNGNSMLAFVATASAVDGFTITNAATAGHTVDVAATGSDTDITITLTPKGSGRVVVAKGVSTGTAASMLQGTNAFSMLNSGILAWSSTTDWSGSKDTSMSRNAAGIVQFGTTTSNALGSWMATNGTLSGTLSVTGHTTFEGVTSTGATGTGKLVYDTSPTIPIVTKSTAANYTVGTTNAAESYGGVVYVTSAATITLPAVVAGMSCTVITIGAIAVSVDPNASEVLVLDGTALTGGHKATNLSHAGDIIVLTYYGSGQWYAASNAWTDGG